MAALLKNPLKHRNYQIFQMPPYLYLIGPQRPFILPSSMLLTKSAQFTPKFALNRLTILYDGTSGKICGDVIDFPIEAGTRQGGIESPTVFNWFFDWVLKVAAYEIDQCFPKSWGI